MARPDDLRHSLLLTFDTEDPEFARGFEAGRVWTALIANPDDEVSEIVHGSNAEMFLRMAEHLSRSVTSVELDETWIEVNFEPARERLEA